jgi:hypothetical protein
LPTFKGEIWVDVRNRHRQHLLSTVSKHLACRPVDVPEAGVRGDPIDCIHDIVDGKGSQLQRLLRLLQLRDVLGERVA